jgi:mycothiol system anti-sigma-R factor
MGDCEETLRELERFLDKELTGQAQHAIQAHIDGCLDCLHAFDFQAELKEIISAKCQSDQLPPGLLSRIEACFGDDITAEYPV